MLKHNLLETQDYFECQHNLALLYENTTELDSLVEVEHLETAYIVWDTGFGPLAVRMLTLRLTLAIGHVGGDEIQ